MNEQRGYTLTECLKILNVNKDASVDDIKRAYRRLVKKYHPDIAGRNEVYVEKFREITKAYQTLLQAIDKDKGRILFEDNRTTSLREFLKKRFRIRNYIELFRRRKKVKDEQVKFGEVFLKRVSPEILRLSEDELILRLEGSDNFYVILESIKAIYRVGTKKGLVAIVENFYKYPEELKKFVLFLLRRKLTDDFFEDLRKILKRSSYNITVSIVDFLFRVHDKRAKAILRDFIKDYISYLKNFSIFLESLKIKFGFKLNKSELRLGERLILMKKIYPYQLVIGLSVKEKFPSQKIGKILIDLGFVEVEDIRKCLQ